MIDIRMKGVRGMELYEQYWNEILELLEANYDESVLHEVFIPCKYHKFSNGYIDILCPNEFILSKLNKFYINRINQMLSKITEEKIKIRFILLKDIEIEVAPTQENATTIVHKKRNINANHRFENYVVGQSNRFAFSMAMKIAHQPSQVANPFYIFGSVGLGKTHLMQAIGNYILDNDINTRLLYIKANQFMEDYSNFCRGKLDNFKQMYYEVDILLIDDIQVLELGEKSQREFFNLFDYLYDNNKQIIITSDRPAQELNIMERLSSRFAAGLVADIQTPDSEHRVNILKRKMIETTQEEISDDVLEFIAAKFTNNIRELEGALMRVLQYCEIYNVPVTLNNCKEALQSLLANRKISDSQSNHSISNVIDVVADFYSLSVDDLIGKNRQSACVTARHIAMYIIYKNYGISYKKIGSLFGNRDHTTVLSAVDKMETELKTNEGIQLAIQTIEKKLS